MKYNLQDRIISLAIVAACIALAGVLLFVMGKVDVGDTTRREVVMDFGRIDNIKPNVTEVKVAGLAIGRVTAIRILTPRERAGLEASGRSGKNVRLTARIDPAIPITTNAFAEIRQASLMSEHFVEINIGPPETPKAPDQWIVDGRSPAALNDLMAPGAALVAKLDQTALALKELVTLARDKVPGVTDSLAKALAKATEVMENARELTADLSAPHNREKIEATLGSIKKATADLETVMRDAKVVSADLKVISTNSKLLTATLAQRPWRMMFGGKPNELPDEATVIKSMKPVPVKPAEGRND